MELFAQFLSCLTLFVFIVSDPICVHLCLPFVPFVRVICAPVNVRDDGLAHRCDLHPAVRE